MSWFQTRDATNSFRETVQVGIEGSFYHEVTIYYYNRGRGGKLKLFLSTCFFQRHFDFAKSLSKYIQYSLVFFC